MISIISAFGGQHIQDALYKDMQGQNMFFSLEDCSNGISLIMAVEQHPDVDVIVIGHTVVKDIEVYLSQIREITKTARIVLLLNGRRHQYIQEQYEGYNRRYNVKDIIFEGDGIDKLKILSIMNKGRLTVEQEIKEEIPDEMPKSAEKPVTVPAQKPNAVEADIKQKKVKPEKAKREKPPRQRKPNKPVHKSVERSKVISLFGVVGMKLSNNQQKVDQSVDWLKRIWIAWAIINGIGAFLAYVRPLFNGLANIEGTGGGGFLS